MAIGTLYVYLNNELIGQLLKISATNLEFIYEDSWLINKYARPISLSMPLSEQPYKGDIVYNFFDNLLPDSEPLRIRLQRVLNINSNHCFDLLRWIGADCVGALRLLPTKVDLQSYTKITATPLSEQQIANILNNYQASPLGMQQDNDFRISIAGAQEKTAFLYYNKQWYLPRQATATSHIFKLPIGKIAHSGIDLTDSIENEWLCLKILQLYNIPVNRAVISRFAGFKVLVCERFDRQWHNEHLIRLPQEDICQALGFSSALKYESDGGPGILKILDFLKNSHKSMYDRKIFLQANIIFWLLAAIDGHAKNFSISLLAKGKFCLTPLYDVMSAYPIIKSKQLDAKKIKMAMKVHGKNKHYHWHSILLRHWQHTAEIAGFTATGFAEIIEEIIDNLPLVISKAQAELPNDFPMAIADPIFQGMLKIKDKCAR